MEMVNYLASPTLTLPATTLSVPLLAKHYFNKSHFNGWGCRDLALTVTFTDVHSRNPVATASGLASKV